MRILITNDDGINAPGLGVLEEIAGALSDDLWVVAPETDQSGSSHSLTLADPLRMRAVDERRFAVRGTPTDCVIMGVRKILPAPPDLVLSGVNAGQNIADDVTYSGTVAGAMEGMLLGVRSIALSQVFGFGGARAIDFAPARAFGPEVLRRVLAADLPADALVNVNFPDRPPAEVRGVAITRQGKRDPGLLFVDERLDGRGQPYYWIAFERHRSEPPPGTDLRAIDEGYVSVTPLALDLTAHALQARLETGWRDAPS